MLKKIRESKGLTQSQLASKSGVNLQMIQKYEQGVKNISNASVSTVLKLAEVLDCSVEELIK